MKNYIKLLLLMGAIAVAGGLRADQTWTGVLTAGNNATNENVSITGDCTIGAAPVSITVNNGSSYSATLSGASRTIGCANSTNYLYINVSSGSFTFDLTGSYNLTFESTGTGAFYIIQTGAGTVTFKLNGGRTLTFKGSGGVESGVRYCSDLKQSAVTPPVGVIWEFNKAGTASANSNAVISLENNSMFTFIANGDSNAGGVGIKAANSPSYTGTLLFNLKDRAAFVLAGHHYTALTPAGIDFATLQGIANMQLLKSGSNFAYNEHFLVLNGNRIVPQLFCDPTRTQETPTGIQHGFIWGAQSRITFQDGTYLDYVGTMTNVDPLHPSDAILGRRDARTVVKQRNPSALMIDGDATDSTTTVTLTMLGQSGLFLRSACDGDGITYFDDSDLTSAQLDFTISPTAQLTGAGNMVMQVEAPFDVVGDADGLSIINVLSRQVTTTTNPGGHIEIDTSATATCFPKFTFATWSGNSSYFTQYAKACIMVNALTNWNQVVLRHDDFIHVVNPTNTPNNSEPVYIGGDTFKLDQTETLPRPTITLINSDVRLHTSAALTGVDLLTTPTVSGSETSQGGVLNTISFWGNGYALDNGTGRALVLGTDTGSYAYDQSTVVDNNSYLDTYQGCASAAADHELWLTSTCNTHEWLSQIPSGASICTQYPVHTVFMGNSSNIQVGTQLTSSPGFTLTTSPTLNINGNFFSFMSQGGIIGSPELSATTGTGGIFVDQKGTVELASGARANFGVMVVKGSPDAVITLPKDTAYFNDRVGMAYWALDLTQTQTIITSGQELSDFTIDWMNVTKDYDGGFVPFAPTGSLTASVTNATLYHIPVVCGQVDEFQIKRSRLGDQAHLLVDGGLIRALVFLSGYDSGEAPTGLLALTNDGEVGIGNSETRRDTSMDASVVLGINGLTIAPNGDGVIKLNTDVTINNLCPIVPGPAFGVSGVNTLTITSVDEHELRIKSGGSLDLSAFTSANQQLVIGGNVAVVMEAGSQLILGGGGITFTDGASLQTEQAVLPSDFAGTAVTDLDGYRAQLIGSGTITFTGSSTLNIVGGSYMGVESDATHTTSFAISIEGGAHVMIGDRDTVGGAFQIGNTSSQATTVTASITINGADAQVVIGKQGFFGVRAGIADKTSSTPDTWKIGDLYNVSAFTLTLTKGTLSHNQIYAGSDAQASMIAFGPSTGAAIYNLGSGSDIYTMLVYGGGNMICTTQVGATTYPVGTTASASVGILAAQPLLSDQFKAQTLALTSVTPTAFFAALKTDDVATGVDNQTMEIPRANIGAGTQAPMTAGYVLGGTIYRQPLSSITNTTGNPVQAQQSMRVGAVTLQLPPSGGGRLQAVEITQ